MSDDTRRKHRAETLTLEFEGFIQCRLATDPDPPTEPRGISGYTFAVGCESDLDQVIRLQRDEIEDGDFRRPFPPYLEEEEPRFGVFVRRVRHGRHHLDRSPYHGAAVRWLDRPLFAIRNQIVADGFNRLAPVVDPFVIEISKNGRRLLKRSDPLDPEQPDKKIWQLAPEDYARRIPSNYFDIGSEVIERLFADAVATNGSVDAFYRAFFQARKEWLQLEISKLETGDAEPPGDCPREVEIQALTTRVFAIDEHSADGPEEAPGRIENRLGLQTVWEFPVIGTDAEAAEVDGIRILTDRPWHTRFWVGGWDGDTLLGYLSGRLDVPFERC